MHTIHKYPFTIEDKFYRMLPVNSKIIHVDCQRGIPMMWVLHTTNTEVVETRFFRIYGTGHEIENVERLTHIATFQMHNGDLIWHLFEEEDEEGSKMYIEHLLKHQPQPTE
jgi:hypothetical protein